MSEAEPQTAPVPPADPSQPAAPDAAMPPPSRSNPEAFRLRAPAPRVTRLSHKMLATLGVAAGLGIGGSLTYALRHRPPTGAAPNVYEAKGRTPSEIVTTAPGDYAKAPKLGAPLPGDLGRPILAAQQNGQFGQAPPPDPRATAAEQARQRLVQEHDSARTSRLFLGGSGAANMGGANDPAMPVAAIEGSTQRATTDNEPSVGTAGGAGQGEKRGFLEVVANRVTQSAERITAPGADHILTAGSIIPAALITGIRSDLPGQVTAQVTQNVYDSPTGRILLIPQGAQLVGQYDSQISAGQNRVLLAWDRLIYPDGRSILLDRQPGTDATGMAGLQDRTNYHWGNMLRATAISTLLGIGTQLATGSDDTLTRALRYGTQDTVNQTGRQLVQREMNSAPTLTIRPGYPLRVLLTHDLILEPPERQP